MEDFEYDMEVGMLGTLRSELDEESDLDSIFVSMQLAHNAIINAYGAQKISSHAAGMILKDLKIKGTDGNYWTIGASTKSWYRRTTADEGAWEIAGEPEGVSLDGEAPFWYVKGVASLISEITQLDEQSKAAETVDELVKESETYEDSTEEVDWIFDEWGKGVEVAELETPSAIVGNMGLPESIPSDFDPSEDLVNALNSSAEYPHERVTGEIFDALDEQEMEFAAADDAAEDEFTVAPQSIEVDVDSLISKKSKLEDYFIPYEEDSPDKSEARFIDSITTPPTETTSITPKEVTEERVKSENSTDDAKEDESYKFVDSTEDFVQKEAQASAEEASIYIDGTEADIEYYMEDPEPTNSDTTINDRNETEGSIYILDENNSLTSDSARQDSSLYISDEYNYMPEDDKNE